MAHAVSIGNLNVWQFWGGKKKELGCVDISSAMALWFKVKQSPWYDLFRLHVALKKSLKYKFKQPFSRAKDLLFERGSSGAIGTLGQQPLSITSSIFIKVLQTCYEEMFRALQLGWSGELNIICLHRKQPYSNKSSYGQEIFFMCFRGPHLLWISWNNKVAFGKKGWQEHFDFRQILRCSLFCLSLIQF